MSEEAKHGSYYYPQAILVLRIRLEDFGDKSLGLANEHHVMTCLAKNVNVEINEYSKADSFNAEIDYKNFPFDPRAIRAVGVTVCMQDMGKLTVDNENPVYIQPLPENTVFVGFADEESISLDDTTKVVRLEGRDLTALLLDRKYLEGNIATDKPLDKVIAGMLAKLEETKDLQVEVRTKLKSLPILASFWSDKGKHAGKRNARANKSYWDIIQEMVYEAGLICYIELDKLIITSPRVLFDRNQAKVFMYGANISDLQFKRKIGRQKGFNILVRCLNLAKKELLEVKIPKDATAEWSKESGISNTEVLIPKMLPVKTADGGKVGKDGTASTQDKPEPAPYMVFSVVNVTSKKQLLEVGQSLYEEMSRQQLEGSFSTKEMAMRYQRLDGQMETFSILKMRVGTPIVVEITGTSVDDLKRVRNISGIESFLSNHKMNPKIANSLAQSIGRANTPFYTKSVKFSMDANNGFSAEIEFINFIETTNPHVKGG